MTPHVAAPGPSARGMPALARLGFDYGWLFLSPRFLNLGQPSLLVDRQLIGDAQKLGLEPFGCHDPRHPFSTTKILVGLRFAEVSLWSVLSSAPRLLARASVDKDLPEIADIARARCCNVIVGDTYAVQLSWSALWRCDIGAATVGQPQRQPGLTRQVPRGNPNSCASTSLA